MGSIRPSGLGNAAQPPEVDLRQDGHARQAELAMPLAKLPKAPKGGGG